MSNLQVFLAFIIATLRCCGNARESGVAGRTRKLPLGVAGCWRWKWYAGLCSGSKHKSSQCRHPQLDHDAQTVLTMSDADSFLAPDARYRHPQRQAAKRQIRTTRPEKTATAGMPAYVATRQNTDSSVMEREPRSMPKARWTRLLDDTPRSARKKQTGCEDCDRQYTSPEAPVATRHDIDRSATTSSPGMRPSIARASGAVKVSATLGRG